MAGWFENNMSAIREYPFDFDRYLEERLREINDLDERRFTKELLLNGLGRVIGCMEEKYKKLEQRIFEEMEIRANQYGTVMTIVRREHYDPSNETLYPVLEADLKPDSLAKALSDDGRRFVETIFLEADDTVQQAFAAAGRFPGSGTPGAGGRMFSVRPAARYREAVERLYQVFQDNHIPWQTVHMGYLDKFYDVYAEAYGWGGPGTAGEGPQPEAVSVDYGEYAPYIRRSMIPLWNMEQLPFDSTQFMIPCTDGIYYEHEFPLQGRGETDGYLALSNEDILEIRHEKKKIVLKTKKEIFEGWRILHMIQKPAARSLDYDAPFLSNHRKDSFIRRYAEHNGSRLMTKTDLFRRIMELDTGDFIEAAGYEITDCAGETLLAPDMNWFARDELFPMEGRKTLALKFKEKKPGHYLNGSMARFVLSQLQMEIGEYRCAGMLEGGIQ